MQEETAQNEQAAPTGPVPDMRLETLKEMRRQIIQYEKLIQESKFLIDPRNSLIIFPVNAWENLIVTRHWIGRIFHQEGKTNPYPESKDSTSKKIEPLYDEPKNWDDAIAKMRTMDEIAMVKELRAIFTNMAELVLAISTNNPFKDGLSNAYLTIAHISLMQANHWLGEQLGVIRNNQ
jgi:hypothetical protein